MKYIYSLGDVLGSGQFGTVVKGEWHKKEKEGEEEEEREANEKEEEGKEKEEVVEVAVKTLKESSSSMRIIKFLREAALMGQFNHPNVVSLYGVVTEGEPVSLRVYT